MKARPTTLKPGRPPWKAPMMKRTPAPAYSAAVACGESPCLSMDQLLVLLEPENAKPGIARLLYRSSTREPALCRSPQVGGRSAPRARNGGDGDTHAAIRSADACIHEANSVRLVDRALVDRHGRVVHGLGQR